MNEEPNHLLNNEEKVKLFDFLREHPVAVLATVDHKGNPHASTIYYSVDDNLNITFTTKRDTRKHQNIAQHDTVMLCVFEAATQTAVQVVGKARESTDPSEVLRAFSGTLNAAQQTAEDNVPPIAKILGGPYVAFTIKPDDIWMSEYNWGDTFANALKHINDTRDNTTDPS